MSEPGDPLARPKPGSPLLEQALLLTFVMHAVAMLAMAALLLPMLPGGGTESDAARVALLAAHPLRFRLGWLPWHLTALSDLLLSVALLRAAFIPRGPAWAALGLTALAVLPDQGAQLLWVTRGVTLARQASSPAGLQAYLAFEARVFPLTSSWAALLYTASALGWTWCFAKARVWSPALTRLSWLLWPLFFAITVGPLLPPPLAMSPALAAAGNALGFVLLEVWLLLVAEQVMRRSCPETAHGAWARWRHPRFGLAGRLLELLANARAARAFGALLPPVELRGDLVDMIYVSYLVEASRLAPLVPPGLALQRLGPDGRYALFTFLTFRHGHLGPSLLGPLRRLLPSPVQSNWRLYVRDPATGASGVSFFTNAVSSAPHALAAKLLAAGMPMHLFSSAALARSGDGRVRLALDPGRGSAPDARADLRPAPRPPLEGPWAECFADYEAMLRYHVPQDRALSTQPWLGRTTRQEISLGIALDACEPLEGEVSSEAAARLVGAARPLCFRVPSADLRALGEQHDAWG